MPWTVIVAGRLVIGEQAVVSAWAGTGPSVRASPRTTAMRYEAVRMSPSLGGECDGDCRHAGPAWGRTSSWADRIGGQDHVPTPASGAPRRAAPRRAIPIRERQGDRVPREPAA